MDQSDIDGYQRYLKGFAYLQLKFLFVCKKKKKVLKNGDAYLIISKRDKSECTERFGNEDVGDFTILHKVLPQLIGRHVFCAAANKYFAAAHGLIGTNLRGNIKCIY